MTEKAKIHLKDIHVDGVDTLLRAQSLKQMVVGKGKVGGRDTCIKILQGVSLDVNHGERVGIIGRNGSGKSSLLKVIAGIYPPTSGTVSITGKITPIIEMGMGLEPEFTGRQNIRIGLLYTGQLVHYNRDVEEKVIEFTELRESIDQPLKAYSTGMRARLAFALAVFQEPEILILDEIFATGDVGFQQKATALIKEKLDSVSVALMVNHSTDVIENVCNRCIWMQGGKIVMDGKPEEVIGEYNRSTAN